MPSSIEDILQRCQLFAAVKDVRRRKLAESSSLRKFSKGQIIFHQGDPCPGVYVLGSGTVRLYKTGTTGKEHVLHLVGPGGTFAEVAAIAGFDCPASAEAVTAAVCALIPLDRFQRHLRDDHELCLELMSGLSFWVRHTITLLEDIVLRDATGRVARFLLEAEPEERDIVKLPGLKRHVASHLNLTSETLSRTLSRLIEARLIIDLENNRVRIVDRDGLRAISEGLFPQV
jgi:CRP/FNR family transcriptional regulator